MLYIYLCLLSAVLHLMNSFPIKNTLIEEVQEDLNGLDAQVRLEHSMLRRATARKRHERRLTRLKHTMVYLRRFGYLEEGRELNAEHLSTSLKAAQQLLGVPDTGTVTSQTLTQMNKARCGNSDVPVRVVQADAQLSHRDTHKRVKKFARVSKWNEKIDNNDVLRLTWFIQKYTADIPRDDVRKVVQKAFKLWADQVEIPSLRTITLEFSEADSSENADINILWDLGDHGDMYHFDDGGSDLINILAHTFYPNYSLTGSLNGDIHLDDFETWVTSSNDDGGVHFPYVLVHEIGHALGLGHSKKPDAVMNPLYKSKPLDRVVLDVDDKCAVNWNYVGTSHMCLFVYLMIELLPPSNQTSNKVHGLSSAMWNAAGSDINDHQQILNDPEEMRRLNSTIAALQSDSSIPSCKNSAQVQVQYEVLLENNIELPKDVAKQYGPVVCNFLDGLADMVETKTQKRVRRSSHVSVLSAHAYSHQFASINNVDHDQLSTHQAHPTRSRRRVHPNPDQIPQFTTQFYEQLLIAVTG